MSRGELQVASKKQAKWGNYSKQEQLVLPELESAKPLHGKRGRIYLPPSTREDMYGSQEAKCREKVGRQRDRKEGEAAGE